MEETTIDFTPSWGTVARIYAAAIEHSEKNTMESKRAVVNAREGLIQMGELLDKCLDQLKHMRS